MVASTDIKFYVHSNNNAPQLQNAYGSMIGVLDACLVNGISLGLASSLTAMGTTVTAVFSTAHNLMQYQVLKITGANQAEYNGEHRILTVPNATSVTFELGSAPSTTTATGTITASLPPLGWEKPFSSANAAGGGKAAYRSKNMLLPSRPFLRVVDELDPAYTATYAKFAKVGLVEDMASIDTLLGVQAPYDALNPNKNWVGTGAGGEAFNGWSKWYYSTVSSASINSAARESNGGTNGNAPWFLVGNGDYFYILPSVTPTDTSPLCYGFGSFKSLLNSDSANNFICAHINYVSVSSPISLGSYSGLGGRSTQSIILLQRNHAQNTQFQSANNTSTVFSGSALLSGANDYIGISGITPFTPVYIVESVLRGELIGLFWLHQRKPYINKQFIEDGGALYIAIDFSPYSANSGQIVFKAGDL